MEELAPPRAAAEFSFEFRELLSAPNPMLVMDGVNCGYHNEETGENKTIVSKVKFSLQIIKELVCSVSMALVSRL